MSLLARLVSLVLLSVGLAVGLTSFTPAQAISCEKSATYANGTTVTSRTKTCTGWNGRLQGAAATKTYSSYVYYSRFGERSVYMSLRLRDTFADGKCAHIRAKKTGMYSFDTFQAHSEVCGKGEWRNVEMSWREQNITPGALKIFVCAGKLEPTCKRIWTQKFS